MKNKKIVEKTNNDYQILDVYSRYTESDLEYVSSKDEQEIISFYAPQAQKSRYNQDSFDMYNFFD